MIDDDDEEEDDDALLRHKSRDVEIDNNLWIEKEAEEKEKVAREAEENLKAQKTIFPLWKLERILNEAVNNLNSYWLEPVRYFELENSMDLQFDLWM